MTIELMQVHVAVERNDHGTHSETWEPLVFHWLFILGPWYICRFAFWLIVWIIVGFVSSIQSIFAGQGQSEYNSIVYKWMKSSAIDVKRWLKLLFA